MEDCAHIGILVLLDLLSLLSVRVGIRHHLEALYSEVHCWTTTRRTSKQSIFTKCNHKVKSRFLSIHRHSLTGAHPVHGKRFALCITECKERLQAALIGDDHFFFALQNSHGHAVSSTQADGAILVEIKNATQIVS